MSHLFLSLWNYLKGYVIVEVSGYTLEKFMNLAIRHQNTFWNIKRKDGKIYLSTTIEGFKRLKPYAKKARCRMRIVEKRGLPFLTFRYRKRIMFSVGVFLFIGCIYLLSSFVWLVEVQGCERLNETEVIETLEESGYKAGRLKARLNLREAEQKLINTYPDIIWTGIKFEGTKLVVEISESVPKPTIHTENAPCHLVAKNDGLITYIATDKGMPGVKKGDTVKKGDILVSGSMQLGDEGGSLYLTHAKATVKAKTGYALEASMPLETVQKVYTNRVSTKCDLRLFDLKIPFLRSHTKEQYDDYDEVITVKQFKLTDQFPLPFYYEKEQKVEYTPYKQPIDEESAKEKLYGTLYDALLKKLGDEAQVIYHEVVYSKDDNKLVAKLQAIVEEDISEALYLTPQEMMPQSEVEGENE